MEQYKKNSPEIKKEKTKKKDPDIQRIEEKITKQDSIINELQREIRHLKSKLDRHADHLNKKLRG